MGPDFPTRRYRPQLLSLPHLVNSLIGMSFRQQVLSEKVQTLLSDFLCRINTADAIVVCHINAREIFRQTQSHRLIVRDVLFL